MSRFFSFFMLRWAKNDSGREKNGQASEKSDRD